MSKLGDYCIISSEGTPLKSNREYYNGNILWATISDIELSNGFITDTKEKITKEGLLSIGNKIFPQGTLLLSMYGSIGKTAFAPKPLSTNQAILGIRPKKEKEIYLPYLDYWFKKNIEIIKNKSRGGVLKNISAAIVKDLEITLPNYHEQIKIVALFLKVKNLITYRKESIRLIDKLADSIFLNMFGDPITNPKGYKKYKLSTFGEVSTGNTPSRSKKKYYNEKYIEWIKTDNLLKDKLHPTESLEYLSLEGSKVSRIVKKDSILVTCIAGSLKSIGTLALTNRRISFNQQINAIQPFDNINSLFLYQMLKLSNNYIKNETTKGMKNIINKSTFENLEFPKPKYSLQEEFGKKFLEIEKLKNTYINNLSKVNRLFDALMQKIFNNEMSLDNINIQEKIEELNIIEFHDYNISLETKDKKNEVSNKKSNKSTIEKINLKGINISNIANLIKNEFKNNYFNIEMLIKFLKEEKLTINYYTSKEIKENNKIDINLDIKNIIFQFIDRENEFLKIEQVFYNGEEKNFKLEIKSKYKDFVKGKNNKEISGIYLRVIK